MKKIVIGALFLSILHSVLFYGQDFGVSVVLFTLPMLLLIIYSLVSKNKVKNEKAFWLTIPIVMLSAAYALFNNVFLSVINFIAIIGLTTTMIIWALYDKLKFTEMFVKFFVIIFAPIGHIWESVKVIYGSIFKKEHRVPVIKESKVLKQIFIGLIISIPLLILILALLISADTMFAQILGPIKEFLASIINIKFLTSIYFRIILIILVLIYIVAFVCTILRFDTETKKVESKGIRMQNITVNTVLTVLNVVYLLFSIVQFAYLFTNLGASADFDYASYARRGFFQLMIVTLINFAIILLTSLNKKETSTGVALYTKIMNSFLIIFTGVMIVSSFLRMYLYEQEYGYTFLRLLVYFILLTEFIATIPTFVYVYNRKMNLLKYYVGIFAVMLVVMNFCDVDRTIARKNVDVYIAKQSVASKNVNEENDESNKASTSKLIQLKKKEEVDFEYLKGLSVDAAPEIVRLYNNTTDSYLKNQIETYFKHNNKYKKLSEKRSFQEFNLGVYQAQKVVNSYNK